LELTLFVYGREAALVRYFPTCTHGAQKL